MHVNNNKKCIFLENCWLFSKRKVNQMLILSSFTAINCFLITLQAWDHLVNWMIGIQKICNIFLFFLSFCTYRLQEQLLTGPSNGQDRLRIYREDVRALLITEFGGPISDLEVGLLLRQAFPKHTRRGKYYFGIGQNQRQLSIDVAIGLQNKPEVNRLVNRMPGIWYFKARFSITFARGPHSPTIIWKRYNLEG